MNDKEYGVRNNNGGKREEIGVMREERVDMREERAEKVERRESRIDRREERKMSCRSQARRSDTFTSALQCLRSVSSWTETDVSVTDLDVDPNLDFGMSPQGGSPEAFLGR